MKIYTITKRFKQNTTSNAKVEPSSKKINKAKDFSKIEFTF